MRKFIYLLLGGVFLISSTTFAAEVGEFDTYDLGEMVVTTSVPGVRDVSPTQIITSDQITAYGAKTAVDVLRHARGVTVTTGRKNQPDINMRGFTQEKILIMIDGVPYYETNYGKLNLDQIPADIISKVEIVQGTASVLYGANAPGGVINFITKTGGEKMATQAFVEVGDYGNYRMGASNGAKIGKFNYWVNAGREYQRGWRMAHGFDPRMGEVNYQGGSGRQNEVLEDGGQRTNSDRTVNTFWGRVGYTPNENGEYFMNISVMNAERGMPSDIDSVNVNTGGNFSNFNRYGEYNDIGLDLSGKQKFGNFTLQGKIFYHQHDDEFESYTNVSYQNLIATSTYKDYFYGLSLIGDYNWGKFGTTHASFHFKEDSHKERDTAFDFYKESKSQTGSIGVQHDLIIHKFLIVVGASYDWCDVTKTEAISSSTGRAYPDAPLRDSFNPMAGIGYLFDNGRIYASLAHKTRFPTLQYLYSGSSGNPDLDPEKTMNYTIGAEYTFYNKLTLGASGFFYQVKNLIDRPDRNSRYQNYGDMDVIGFDISATFTPIDRLTISMDYTQSHGKNKTDPRLTDNVIRVPKYKIDASVSYKVPVTETLIDLNAIWAGEMWTSLPTPGYPTTAYKKSDNFGVINLKVSQPLFKYFTLYAELHNILDADYESEPSVPNPGRNFWVGLRATF